VFVLHDGYINRPNFPCLFLLIQWDIHACFIHQRRLLVREISYSENPISSSTVLSCYILIKVSCVCITVADSSLHIYVVENGNRIIITVLEMTVYSF